MLNSRTKALMILLRHHSEISENISSQLESRRTMSFFWPSIGIVLCNYLLILNFILFFWNTNRENLMENFSLSIFIICAIRAIQARHFRH